MRKKVIKPNQKELSNIQNAEREIKDVCEKYNVKIEGAYWVWDDFSNDDPHYSYTDEVLVRSLDYVDREKRYNEARKVWERYKQQQSDLRYRNKMMVLYPNHRELKVISYPNDASVLVQGLRIKDLSLVKSPLFSWNTNNYWQCSMTEFGLHGSVLSTIYMSVASMSLYDKRPRLTFFAHPGDLRVGIYSDGRRYQSKSDTTASSLLIRMVDQMIELGVLEFENQVNP